MGYRKARSVRFKNRLLGGKLNGTDLSNLEPINCPTVDLRETILEPLQGGSFFALKPGIRSRLKLWAKAGGGCSPRPLSGQKAPVIETTTVLPAIDVPSLVDEKFGCR